ncbi:MAG: hypothetical protein Q9181_006534 [Wetmoreana brouardii]
MTHPTLTATHIVTETVKNRVSRTSTMSEDDSNTPAPLPSSINRPSASSSTRDAIIPSSIIPDTSTPLTSSSTTSISASTTSTTSTTPPVFNTPTPTESTAQTSASATTAAAAAAQPVLTKPQIAGVTVGSIAAAGLVFGLLALFFWLRGRRKKQRRSSDASFGNDRIVIDRPRTPSQPSAVAAPDVEGGNREVGISEPYRQDVQAATARPQSTRWSFWRKSIKPEDIGVAVAPSPAQQTAYDRSPVTPMSAASYETASRLLPDKPTYDKPTYSLFPPPLRLSSYNTQVSPIDAPEPQYASFGRAELGTVVRPAPRGRGTMDTSQTHLHLGQPTIRAVPSDPFIDASSSSRTADPQQFRTLPAQRPKVAASHPVIHQYGQWAEPAQLPRKPVPARLPPNSLHAGQPSDALNHSSYLPPHLATLAADPLISQKQGQPSRRKSSGRRKANERRPETFLSTSDTSFEDAGSDDELPPPLPQSTLSPVVESPPSRPQTAGVRYPVVPTSAAESPSVNRTVREVRREREQLELNPASDRSKGKAKASPKTPSPKMPSPRDKALPSAPPVPELVGTELRERQQAPDSSSERIKPGSAKWNILVAPGMEGIENIGSPSRSKASGEWTPLSTPTRRPR